jgi:hypothetical protein
MENTKQDEAPKEVAVSRLALALSETLNLTRAEQRVVWVTNRGRRTHAIVPVNLVPDHLLNPNRKEAL